MGVSCVACGEEHRDQLPFCTRCGAAVPSECPACGRRAELDARYCAGCGTPLSPGPLAASQQRERKQLTVLVADIERSMEMHEKLDPEDWAGILGPVVGILSEGVRRFGGTIDKFTGDGVMAYFGAPIAQEDHARRACHAARWIADAVAGYARDLERARGLELHVRLGLSSSEVLFGRLEEARELEPIALGHGVGLAQRMESIAEPGRPHLTEPTARLVARWFELEDLGERAVKGASEPLRVYALGSPLPQASPAGPGRRATPLVAREMEWATLNAAWEQALSENAHVVGVVGEPGVGKSRLCQDWAQRLAGDGVKVHRTAGVSHGGDVPLLPMLGLVRDYFRIDDGDGPAVARRKVVDRVLALDPSLEVHLPVLFDFLEVADPEQPLPRQTPERRMRRIFGALRAVMERRSSQEALVLLLEDLHWFDAQSVAFLGRLIDTYAGTRTLLVTNFRPEFHEPWSGRPEYTRLELDSLPEAAVVELLGNHVGRRETVAALTDVVISRTRGNPLFVEEIVRTLVEDGTLEGVPGDYRLVRTLDDAHVPAGVHAVLAARIDRLTSVEKRVLQSAAVVGSRFSGELMTRVMGVGASVLREPLERLCAAELLQRQGDDDYRFWHPLTQEVAYSTLLAARRGVLHATVAQALIDIDGSDEQAAVIAWHWERAHRILEAARWTARAGEFAVRSDLDEGLRRWRRAGELLGGIEQGLEALDIAVRTRTRILQFGARTGMDPDEAEAIYREGRVLAERLGDVARLGVLIIMAGSARFWRGDVQEALTRCREAAALSDRTENPEVLAALWFGAGFVLAYAGSPVDGLAATERVVNVVEGDPDLGAGLMGYSPLARTLQVRAGMLARAGRLDRASAELAESLRLARPRHETDTVAWALAAVPHIEWLRGEMNDGPAAAEEALRLAEESGNTGALVLALNAMALVHLSTGCAAEAARACERGLDEARSRESGLFEEPRLLTNLALARVEMGEHEEARRVATEAVAIAEDRAAFPDQCYALLARARSLAGLAAPDAIADLGAALDLAERTGTRSYEALIREDLGRLRGDESEMARAQNLYRQIGATGRARGLSLRPPAEWLP